MDFNRKLEDILKDIREIENDAVDLSSSQTLSRIDMDLLMGKVRGLYDKLITIDRNYPYSGNDNPQEVSFEYHEPEKQPHNHTPETDDSQAPQATSTNPSTSTRQEQSSSGKQQTREKSSGRAASETNKARETASWKSSTETRGENPEIVADKFQNAKTFRHEDLARKQPQNNLSARMQSKPITDLGKAIGLNDKFLFVRELFEGDKEKYHEAIQIINEMPNYEEAEEYIRQRFNWDEEKPEVNRFMDLVRRKFTVQS